MSMKPVPPKRIRYEKYSNADSYYPKEVWEYYKEHGGQPKPSELVIRPATEWYVLVHDPDRFEGCERHTFNSIEDRKAWLDAQQK